MEENKSIEVLNNDNLIEQLFKFKKEFNLIISLVKKNIKIRFAYTENSRRLEIFKGDCDQDRPS